MSDIRYALNYLVVNFERRKPLWKYRCEWEDIIKADLKGTGREGVELIQLAQYRIQCLALVNTEMGLPVP
jgi:hypothetical protein